MTRRVIAVPDNEPFDDSFLECQGETDLAVIEERRKELWNDINSLGVWGYVIQEECPSCGEWKEVDSCWAFVGKQAALDAGKATGGGVR